MKKFLKSIGLLGLALLAGIPQAAAETAEEPIMQFHTTIAGYSFHFIIGAKENTYIDVDCGYGPVEVEVGQAVFDYEVGEVVGTAVSCQTTEEGIVRIYGDASLIDYLDMEGCYITDITWPQMTEVEILNLTHNKFESLDLSHMSKLQALYLDDNPMSTSGVIVGPNKPDLTIMMMSMVGDVDPSFNLSDYPAMRSFIAFSTPSLTRIDPTGCPYLIQLSVDGASISSIDTSKNPLLRILNVSDTKVTSLDLSKNSALTELYCSHNSAINDTYKIKQLDLSPVPNLVRLFIAGNHMESIDVSMLPYLEDLSAAHNRFTDLNIDANPAILTLDLNMNNMDYVTLPAERSSFIEYYYTQNPFPTEKSYAVGSVIDFSDKVNRPESTTDAALYLYKEENPSTPELVDASAYSWDNGKLTLLAAQSDSAFVVFHNSALPEYNLQTAKFAIKSAADFGKPSAVASFKLSPVERNYALSAGIAGATPENPKKFYVDFGNGVQQEFLATGNTLPAAPNASASKPSGGNSTVTVYLSEGDQLTALGVDNQRILSADLTQAHALKELSLTDCKLPDIDLSWNRSLVALNLSGNSLSTLDLTGINGPYEKYQLEILNVSGNNLTQITNPVPGKLKEVDYSNNQMAVVELLKMNQVKQLNLSGNLLEEVDLRDLEAIESLNLSNNSLTSVLLLDYLPLTDLNLSNNNIAFESLPAVGVVANYTYAPQKEVSLPARIPVVSLTKYLFDSAAGQTVYTWYMADTDTPVAEGNIRENEGHFFFTNPDLGRIYCTIANPAFPDFAGADIIRTSVVETAPMPTHVFATFTPEADGIGSLILTGQTKGTDIYVDWTGEGDMEQYILEGPGAYTEFTGAIKAGKQAKCYSYDDNDGVYVFSISCGKLSQLDASLMKGLKAFMAYGTGLNQSNLKMPESPVLDEISFSDLTLSGSDFLRKYPEMAALTLGNCRIGNVDLSVAPKLEYISIVSCGLTDIKLNNPHAWNLNLAGNQLRSIDLSGMTSLQQLYLFDNELTSIDLENLNALRILHLENNSFTFETLPLPKGQWTTYGYANQALMEIEVADNKVDLSSQLEVNGVPTEYHWFIDAPYLDENNELAGEELVEGDEYTLENGITTFNYSFDHIMCVMTNSVFPNLYLLTTYVDVNVSGIENVTAEAAEADAEYFNLQGVRVAKPSRGLYIMRRGSEASKVFIR